MPRCSAGLGRAPRSFPDGECGPSPTSVGPPGLPSSSSWRSRWPRISEPTSGPCAGVWSISRKCWPCLSWPGPSWRGLGSSGRGERSASRQTARASSGAGPSASGRGPRASAGRTSSTSRWPALQVGRLPGPSPPRSGPAGGSPSCAMVGRRTPAPPSGGSALNSNGPSSCRCSATSTGPRPTRSAPASSTAPHGGPSSRSLLARQICTCRWRKRTEAGRSATAAARPAP